VAGLERENSVKAHAGWTAPHKHIAMFEQDALGGVGALQASQQKHAFEPSEMETMGWVMSHSWRS